MGEYRISSHHVRFHNAGGYFQSDQVKSDICKLLGWGRRFAQIADLLGFHDRSPGEQEFVEAISRWQRTNHLSDDGIVGPKTWSRLEPLTRFSINLRAPPQWLSQPVSSASVRPPSASVPLETATEVSRPYQINFLDHAALEFSLGFVDGLSGGLDGSLAGTASNKICAEPGAFYAAFVKGTFFGLAEGLTSTLEFIGDVAQFASKISDPTAPIKEITLNIVSSSHRQLRLKQLEEIKLVAAVLAEVIVEIHKRPMLYIAKSRKAGHAVGEGLATHLSEAITKDSAEELGEAAGRIYGRVAFEIILTIVLAHRRDGSRRPRRQAGGGSRGDFESVRAARRENS
jgi:hypothetical protein